MKKVSVSLFSKKVVSHIYGFRQIKTFWVLWTLCQRETYFLQKAFRVLRGPCGGIWDPLKGCFSKIVFSHNIGSRGPKRDLSDEHSFWFSMQTKIHRNKFKYTKNVVPQLVSARWDKSITNQPTLPSKVYIIHPKGPWITHLGLLRPSSEPRNN